MKKIISILVFPICIFANAQSGGVPISALPSYSGSLSGIWIPVAAGATTKKIDAGQIAYTKMDSLYERNDSLFGKKNNSTTEFFIKSDITVLDNIAALKSIAATPLVHNPMKNIYHIKGFYNANDGGGGDFILIDTSGASAVNGMIIPAGSGKAFVRPVNGNGYDITMFGGIGGGIATYKQDSAALRDGITYLKTLNRKTRFHIPASSNYYGFNGDGIVLGDNIEIWGDGNASEIRHVNPASGTVQFGVIFYTGTYGPNNALSIFKPTVPKYYFQPQTKGNSWVDLVNAADTIHFKKGEIYVLGARYRNKGTTKQILRNSETVMDEFITNVGNRLYFKHAFQEDFVADTANPKIFDVNSGYSTRTGLGTDICTKNVYIHDLYLSQADYNEIDGTPLDLMKKPTNVIGYGETFESRFERLTLKSFGTFGGNMYNYCTVQDLSIVSSRKVFDFGYGSTNNFVNRINWQYYPSSFDDTTGEKSMTYFDDDFHHNIFTNITVSGNQTQLNLFQLTRGAHDNLFDNWTYNLPSYIDTSISGANSLACLKFSDDTGYIQHDNIVRNFHFKVNKISQVMTYEGVSTNSRKINNYVQNITFDGAIINKVANPAVDLAYSGNTVFENIRMSDGNVFRRVGADTGTFRNINAPTMDFYATDAVYTKENNNNIFKSSKTGATINYTPSANAPANPVMGMTYMDSVLKQWRGWDGSAWQQFSGSGGGGASGGAYSHFSGSIGGSILDIDTTAIFNILSGSPIGTGGSITSGPTKISKAGTLKNFYVYVPTVSQYNVYGSIIICKNGTPTSILIDFPEGSYSGWYSDLTHSVSVSVGDEISFKIAHTFIDEMDYAAVSFTGLSLGYETAGGGGGGGGAGTVTKVATNSGTGLKTVSGSAITDSGTIYNDTAIISTRNWVRNKVDSINSTKTKVLTMMSTNLNATVAANLTQYGCFGSSNLANGENTKSTIIVEPGILRNLYINTRGTSPSTGTCVVTVRINSAATTLTVTIPISLTTGTTISDLIHSANVVAGDIVTISVQNNSATDPTTNIVGVSLGIYKN